MVVFKAFQGGSISCQVHHLITKALLMSELVTASPVTVTVTVRGAIANLGSLQALLFGLFELKNPQTPLGNGIARTVSMAEHTCLSNELHIANCFKLRYCSLGKFSL